LRITERGETPLCGTVSKAWEESVEQAGKAVPWVSMTGDVPPDSHPVDVRRHVSGPDGGPDARAAVAISILTYLSW
jgi:hypothetical protein